MTSGDINISNTQSQGKKKRGRPPGSKNKVHKSTPTPFGKFNTYNLDTKRYEQNRYKPASTLSLSHTTLKSSASSSVSTRDNSERTLGGSGIDADNDPVVSGGISDSDDEEMQEAQGSDNSTQPKEIIINDESFLKSLDNATDSDKWDTDNPLYKDAATRNITSDMTLLMGVVLLSLLVVKVRLCTSHIPLLLIVIAQFISPDRRGNWPVTTSAYFNYLKLFVTPKPKQVSAVQKTLQEHRSKRIKDYMSIYNISDLLQLLFDGKEFCTELAKGIRKQL
jgi:hypothetical protein